MNLLSQLRDRAFDRNADRDGRKAQLRRRPVLDSLEGRMVLSTAAEPFVGPIALAPAAVSRTTGTASVTTSGTTTITQDQQGTAFGMQWRAIWDNQAGMYRLDILGTQGSGNVVINRSKVGITFQTTSYNSANGSFQTVTATGPALHQDKFVEIRHWRNAGDTSLSLGVGLYRSLSFRDRTAVSYMSTPTGQIKLSYAYNPILNTGALTVDNIRGTGRIVYSKAYLNLDPGDTAPSPTPNPIASIDFQLQGSDSYNGGVGILVPGKPDPTITVTINNNNRAGYYEIVRGVW